MYDTYQQEYVYVDECDVGGSRSEGEIAEIPPHDTAQLAEQKTPKKEPTPAK